LLQFGVGCLVLTPVYKKEIKKKKIQYFLQEFTFARQDVLGAKAIYEDLRARFHRSRRNSETDADANVENEG
jgi:hypothetical protein